jgi:ABC-type uncharacterized transport system substrate-binding protein
MRPTAAAILALLLAAPPAAAHPHIFIDTGLEIVLDAAGRATAVKVAWVYDDFYSLVMIQDLGLDPDADGRLTAEEQVRLSGFDMAWDADYAGDLYVLVNGQPVALGRPTDWAADYRGDRIISLHTRPILAPVAGPLTIQVYDPGFYTAYTILGQPRLTGEGAAGCTVQVFEPDLTEADRLLQQMLQEYSADQSLEQDFPTVGANYAEEARVTCGQS